MEIKPINNKRKIVIFKSDINIDKRNFKDWADQILNNSIIFLPSWISYEVIEVDDLKFVLSDDHPETDEFLQKLREISNKDDKK